MILSVFFLLFQFLHVEVVAQPARQLSKGLETIGFENIRVVQSSKIYYIAIENNVFRWEPAAIATALDYISESITDSSDIKLVILDKNVPRYLVAVNVYVWKNFRSGKVPRSIMNEEFLVTTELKPVWEDLKNQSVTNPSVKKTDFIIYPTFAFENTRLDKIYEFQFNIAPVMEVSFWRGNKFSGQVIFPVHNELGYEGDFIRPGYLTIAQEFRTFEKWWGILSAGNFSNNRYGFDWSMSHPFNNENWLLELNTGLTGSSHFYDNNWIHGPVNTITWMAAISWYYEKFDLVFKGGVNQYIYGDKGFMASATRFFGETAVGFYGQFNEYNYNAGINITIPFPVKRRKPRKLISLTMPEHLDFTYNAGTELFYGQYFRANPMINQIKSIKFTSLIKKNVLNRNNLYHEKTNN